MIISWINEKGGVGKSSLCFNSGYYLASLGYKVLLIDMDSQRANLSFFCGIKDEQKEFTMADVLIDGYEIKKTIQEINENLHIVPASADLIMIDKSIRQESMDKAIQEVVNDYDFIFVDVNPTPSRIHALVMGITDYMCIPMLGDITSLEANKGVVETYSLIKEKVNPKLKVLGLVFNKFNGRANLSQQVSNAANEMAAQLKSRVFNTKIRNNIALSENVGSHVGITEYAPSSNGAEDIIDFTNEMLEYLIEVK